MTTDLVTHPKSSTDLTIDAEQTSFSTQQVAVLEHLGVSGASEGDLQVFFHVAKRTGLDPFARQIYMISRNSSVRDERSNSWKTVVKNTIQTGIDGYRSIAGRTGLATRDYDQTAVVTGNLGVSVPVAGALAGGPAIGAALLLFSQVFKEPLKGITRGYYRITGPWEDPVVERVDASEVKAENAGQVPGSSP